MLALTHLNLVSYNVYHCLHVSGNLTRLTHITHTITVYTQMHTHACAHTHILPCKASSACLCVHKQLPGCTVANTWPACDLEPLHCGIPVFTQDSVGRPNWLCSHI